MSSFPALGDVRPVPGSQQLDAAETIASFDVPIPPKVHTQRQLPPNSSARRVESRYYQSAELRRQAGLLPRRGLETGLQPTRVIPRQESTSRRSGSTTIQVVRWILGLGILAWVVRANGGWRIIQLPIEYPGAIGAFILQVMVGAIVEARRIQVLCGSAVAAIPFSFAYRLMGVATLFNIAIPGGTGGDVLKLVMLGQRIPGKRAEFTALLLLDRMIGMTSILLIALLAAALAMMTGAASTRLVGIVVTPALILLGAVVMAVIMAGEGPRAIMLRFVPRSWTRVRGLLNRAYDTAAVLRWQPGTLLGALGMSLLGQAVLATAFAVAAHWLMPGASSLLVAAIALISLIVNAVPVTPGGIGVGEAAFEALFLMAGFRGGARLLLFWRLAQLPLVILGAWYFARHREALQPLVRDAAQTSNVRQNQFNPAKP